MVKDAEAPEQVGVDYVKASRDFRRYLPLKIATFAWFTLAFMATLYALAAIWSGWWPFPDVGLDTDGTARLAVTCIAASALGATTYSFRGFYWAIGPQSDDNRRYQYDPNWTFWYFARPIAGTALGVAVYGALRAGVATFGSSSNDDTALASFFVAGFLAGFSATRVFDWLEALAARSFGSQK